MAHLSPFLYNQKEGGDSMRKISRIIGLISIITLCFGGIFGLYQLKR